MNEEEVQQFADIVTHGLTREDIENLEAVDYDYELNKCINTLHSVVDQVLQQGADPYALMEALTTVASEIDDAFGGDDNA